MQPYTKKRLYSALQEPSLAQESKRAKSAMEDHESVMLIQRENSHLEKNRNKLHFWYRTTDSNQPETPERRSAFSRSDSLHSRGSQILIGDIENPNLMPNVSSKPAILGCKASPNDDYKLMLGPSNGAPQELSSCSDDSSGEISSSASDSGSSLSSSCAPTKNAASPSSPRTISDYRSDSDSESDSGDGLISSHSKTPPGVFHCPNAPVPGSSTLESRLTSFLPAIQAANETLERELAEGRLGLRNIEDVDEDDEQYIEMNLGLGVLEEKPPRDISWGPHEDESESGNSSESEPQTEIDLTSESGSLSGSESDDGRTIEKDVNKENRGKIICTKPQPRAAIQKDPETNHLARLMGQRRRPDQLPKKTIIEVLP